MLPVPGQFCSALEASEHHWGGHSGSPGSLVGPKHPSQLASVAEKGAKPLSMKDC